MKQKRKVLTKMLLVLILFMVLFLASLVTEYYQILFDILTVMTAIIGAYYIWIEFKRSRDLEEASFIISLNDNFNSNRIIQDASNVIRKSDEILNKRYFLAKSEIDKEKYRYISDEDDLKLMPYFTFFETMNLLIKRKIIDLDIIDELFTLRFFEATDNPVVQDIKIGTYKNNYKNIYELHNLWRNYKILHHKKITNRNFCLSNYYDLIYGDLEFKPLSHNLIDDVYALQNSIYDAKENKQQFYLIDKLRFILLMEDLDNFNLCIYEKSNEQNLVGFCNLVLSSYASDEFFTDEVNQENSIYFRTIFIKKAFRKKNIQKSVFIHFVKNALYLRKKYMICIIHANDVYSRNNFIEFGFKLLKTITIDNQKEKEVLYLDLEQVPHKTIF